nr:TenA family protein [Corynebacterium pilosum]
MTDILALPFIRDLADGTLPAEDFRFYLGQDAPYLVRYAAALTALGGAWAEDARGAIADEQLMQRTWLADEPPAQPSTVTQAYTDFLLASVHSQPAAVGQAAVLPCYWLYAEVGVRLAEANHPDHPYHGWLATYAGDDFTEATTAALHRSKPRWPLILRLPTRRPRLPHRIALRTGLFRPGRPRLDRHPRRKGRP